MFCHDDPKAHITSRHRKGEPSMCDHPKRIPCDGSLAATCMGISQENKRGKETGHVYMAPQPKLLKKNSTRLTPLQEPAVTQPWKLDISHAVLDLFRQEKTHFLCDALIAATFSFFSAIRFARRALIIPNISFRDTKGERDALVFRLLLFLMFEAANLEGAEMTTTLETQWCNQPLNLRSVIIAYISQPSFLRRVRWTHALWYGLASSFF